MKNIGYTTEEIITIFNSDNTSNIKVSKQNITLDVGESESVTVIPLEGITTSYILIKGMYYPLEIEKKMVKLGDSVDKIPNGGGSTGLSIISSDESKVYASTSSVEKSMDITINGIAETTNPVKVKVTYEGKEAEINVTVINKIRTLTVKVEDGYEGRGTVTTSDGTVTETEYNKGTSILLIANSADGYEFEGWYSNNEKIVGAGKNYDYIINNTAVITARFLPVTYTITYTDNGGSISSGSKTTSYTVGSNDITLPTMTKTGYTFLGWTGSNGTTPQTSVTISKGSTGDRNYTANWSLNSYTISYTDNGGSISSGSKTTSYTVESNDIALPTMTKTGYTFLGWTGSNGSTPQTNVTISKGSTGDKSYTANWALNSYTISYVVDGGTVSSGNKTTSYTVESNDITLPIMEKTGYTFLGWTGSNGTTPQTSVTISKGSTGNRSYTANWVAKTFAVTLDNQSATTSGTASTTATYSNGMPNITIPTKTGYVFGGYYTSPDGAGTQYYTSTGTSANIWDKDTSTTLYAKWTSTKYRYVKIEVTEISSESAHSVQMSEFAFYDKNNTRFSYPTGTSITSNLAGDNSNELISNLIDNNVETKYCSGKWGSEKTGNCTIIIDLGNENTIDFGTYNKYTYASANDVSGRDPVSWNIYASNDGSNYTLIENVSNQTITTDRKTYNEYWSFSPTKYRYIKIEVTERSGIDADKCVQMSEFAFYDSNNIRFSYPSNTTITANMVGNNNNELISNLIDNNVSTKYCSRGWGSGKTGNCTIVIDLGTGNTIDLEKYNKYTYASANDVPARDPVTWNIYASNDGDIYTLIDNVSNKTVTTDRKTYNEYWSFSPTKYRYVKIEITERREDSSEPHMQMSEFAFYNSSNVRFSYPTNTVLTANLTSNSNEVIKNIIDNNVSTKYCTGQWGGRKTGNCTIIIDLGNGSTIDLETYNKYTYASANDVPARDPVSWNIYASNNGVDYTLVETMTNATVTTERKTYNTYWTLDRAR